MTTTRWTRAALAVATGLLATVAAAAGDRSAQAQIGGGAAVPPEPPAASPTPPPTPTAPVPAPSPMSDAPFPAAAPSEPYAQPTMPTMPPGVSPPAGWSETTDLRTVSAPPTLPAPPPTWEVNAGIRTLYIKGSAYDPFSDNDAFVQFSLQGTRAVARTGRWTLAAGLGLDVGTTNSSARGDDSTLSMIHLSAVVEGRYQPWSRLYLFGRLVPGYLHGNASLDDASSPAGSNLSAGFDTLAIDASAGAALRLIDLGGARFGSWLLADGGYSWAPAEELVLAPQLGSDQSKTGGLDLGSLAARGGFFRLAIALSY